MKLYVAGPMRGYPKFNFPAFLEAASDLRHNGYEVVCPAEEDMKLGFDPNEVAVFSESDYHEAMRRDIEIVLNVDGVATLPGWKDSTGATTEVSVARAIGIPVYSVYRWNLNATLNRFSQVRN